VAASKRAAKTRAATTFHDHLKELRTRAFVVVAVFIVASSVAYNYKDWLLTVLMRPLGSEKLIYLTPAGGFSFIFQVTIYAGLIVTVPVLVYNIFRFISPILSKKTRINSVVIVLSSLVLLAGGVSFGYFYAIPAAMGFLIHFADGFANASLTAESYLGFVMAYTAGLGLLFQLPLLLLFTHWIYPLKPKKLFSFERYMVLIAFVVAAIISPTPDALNQTIIAAPILLMYQIGVVAICVSVYRRNKPAKKVAKAQARALAKEKKALSRQKVPSPQPQRAVPAQPLIVARAPVATVSPTKPQPLTPPPQRQRRSLDGVMLSVPVRPRPVPVTLPPRPPVQRPSALKVAASTHSRRSLDGVSLIFEES
jgi:sec-independent protein translocase protein TatC